jgi:hypothetical protein
MPDGRLFGGGHMNSILNGLAYDFGSKSWGMIMSDNTGSVQGR